MPEAGPDSPGHVGHTPQRVDVALRRTRLEGMLSSNVVRLARNGSTRALQTFPQPQKFAERSLTSVLVSIDETARRRTQVGVREPLPFERRGDVAITKAPR